jgi:hypothetical protein
MATAAPITVCVRIRPPVPDDVSGTGRFVRCVGVAAPPTQLATKHGGTSNKQKRAGRLQAGRMLHVTTEDKPVLFDINGNHLPADHLKSFSIDDVFEETDSTAAVYARCCTLLSLCHGYG